MNGIDFDEMKKVDVRTVDRSTLKDINDVVVDTALPKEDRLRSFIEQIGNPYCYKCGDLVVKVSFADWSLTFRQCDFLNAMEQC